MVLVVLTACAAQTSVPKAEGNSARQIKKEDSPQDIELLMKSVKTSDAATVKRLLSAGVNPNVKDSSGVTPLMIASIRGDLEIAKLLLDAGAEVNATDDIGKTALADAIRFQEKAVIELLLDRGANLSFKEKYTGWTLLHLVADRPDMDADIVKIVLDRSPNVDVRDKHGVTPLKMAAANNHFILEALIKRGADVNAKSNRGSTPLMSAIGAASAMKLLIAHGADVNAKNDDGWTPLELALLNGCPEIIRLLESAGARE
jgi:ankyrin repeat protein